MHDDRRACHAFVSCLYLLIFFCWTNLEEMEELLHDGFHASLNIWHVWLNYITFLRTYSIGHS